MVLAVLATAPLGLVGGMVLAPAPAYAGNWAVTALDPVPDRMKPGKGYTVGMWVLQHGFHPYEGVPCPENLGHLSQAEQGLVDVSSAFVAGRLKQSAQPGQRRFEDE
ncbi:hypothetical protein M2302_002908 [Micromonospora sp. A200]|uniref:hypothetical protein n=1 Tax=Micromonospora sp. A200 TaxID=2940568 RepID=UPI00247413C4|nr:hypothetical protein [Micromonospora sp. A200]MDH6462728.1 hypothetical protein [Micromonospora sp. A200]